MLRSGVGALAKRTRSTLKVALLYVFLTRQRAKCKYTMQNIKAFEIVTCCTVFHSKSPQYDTVASKTWQLWTGDGWSRIPLQELLLLSIGESYVKFKVGKPATFLIYLVEAMKYVLVS